MAKQRRSLAEASRPRDREMANTPAELEAAVLARREAAGAEKASAKVKITILMPAEVARELKIAWQRVPKDEFESITSLLTDAAVDAIQRFRDKYNDGKPFESNVAPRMPRGRRPQE